MKVYPARTEAQRRCISDRFARYLRQWVKRLGIEDWAIAIHVAETEEEAKKHRTHDGQFVSSGAVAYTEPEYERALIWLLLADHELTWTEEELEEDALHEALHVLTGGVVEPYLQGMSKKEKKLAGQNVEIMVSHLARALLGKFSQSGSRSGQQVTQAPASSEQK